jgi:hypothetical protein
MWTMLTAAAFAAPPGTLEGFAGLDTTMNDPFLVRRGARIGGAWRPLPALGFSAAVAAYPNLGQTDLRGAARTLMDQNELVPSISRVMQTGMLGVEATPIRTVFERTETALRFGLGGGGVRTVDDLALSNIENAPEANADRDEILPAWTWSISAETLRAGHGIRVRAAQIRYVEHFDGDAFHRNPVWLGAEWVFRPGSPVVRTDPAARPL